MMNEMHDRFGACWIMMSIENSIDDLWIMLIICLIEMSIDFILCTEYDLSYLLNVAPVKKIHYMITPLKFM